MNRFPLRAAAPTLFVLLMPLTAAVSMSACSDDAVTCGPGTVLNGSECISDTTSSGSANGGASAGGMGGGAGVGGGGAAGGEGPSPIPMFAGATSLSPVSEDALLVTWDPASDDVTGHGDMRYHVYVADSAAGQDFATPTLSVTGVTSLQFGGLDAGSTYYVVVRAEDQDGNAESNTNEASNATASDTTPPSFAGVMSSARASVTEVEVLWAAASDDLSAPAGISYAVYWASNSNAINYNMPALLTAPGATSAIVSVPDNDDYNFAVRAFDAAGNGDSNTVTVVGASSPDTVAPTFAGCSGALVNGAGSALVSWLPGSDDVTAAADLSYHVYASPTPGGQDFSTPTKTVVGGNGTNVTGLDAATTYYFACRAADEAANLSSDNGAEVSVTTFPDSTPPTFAGITSISNPGTTTLDLSWNAADDNQSPASAISYDIYLATMAGAQDFSTPTATSNPGELSYQLTGLTAGTLYYVVVRASDAANNQELNIVEISTRTLVAFAQVQAIFTTSCGISGCHALTTAPLGLRLDTAFFSYQNLCSNGAATSCTPVAAQEHLTQNRIQPGDSASSWVYRKITGSHNTDPSACAGNFCGDPMPPPSCPTCLPVSAENIALIADWISQGAAKL